MRWFLWFLLALALIAGVLFGIGQFLLPNDLSVTRSVQVDRPRSLAFVLANDLRIAREWSPYYAMDPDAEYRFNNNGPGEGQEMHWTSRSRRVGAGRMTILKSTENALVEGDIVLRRGGSLNTRMTFEPTQLGGTDVAWTLSGRCEPGWANVACRYINLINRGTIQQDQDAGLARLKTLVEQLPNVDIEGLELSRENAEPHQMLYVDVTAEQTDGARDAAEDEGVARLNGFFSAQPTLQRGPMVRIFPARTDSGNLRTWIVGYQYQGVRPTSYSGGVRPGDTPGGAVMRFVHDGPRSELGRFYQRACAYLLANRELPYARPGNVGDCIAPPVGVAPFEIVTQTRTLAGEDGAALRHERVEMHYPIQERPDR